MTKHNEPQSPAMQESDLEKITQALDMNSNDDQLNEQLAAMRNVALQYIPEKTSEKPSHKLVWSSFGAAAAALLLFFSISQTPIDDSSSIENSLALLNEAEELEMLENHDIEFYVWLEDELG